MTNAERIEAARLALDAMMSQFSWTLWATKEVDSGWMDGVRELLAIVEIRSGKIIKIKSGGYGDYWMVASESGGWFNLTLLDEVLKQGKFIYQVVGGGSAERFESRQELTKKYPSTGEENASHLREELKGQPKLLGIVGPMFNGHENGVPIIRYETPKEYVQQTNISR